MFLLPCDRGVSLLGKEFPMLPWGEIPSFLIVSNPFLIINIFLALLNKMVCAVSLG